MTKTQKAFLFIGVALIALVSGLYFREAGTGSRPVAVAPSVFDTSLATLDGGKATLRQWHGKVLVVNFWATWCAPCRKEIPDFIRMQDALGSKGVQFVGIAIDEVDAVRKFVKEVGLNYPTLVGDIDGLELGRQLGNELGALPFTVVFDREGNAVRSELGGTNEARLKPLLEELL